MNKKGYSALYLDNSFVGIVNTDILPGLEMKISKSSPFICEAKRLDKIISPEDLFEIEKALKEIEDILY